MCNVIKETFIVFCFLLLKASSGSRLLKFKLQCSRFY